MANKTLFVTCGATVPFAQLLELVLGLGCLERLKKSGFRRVVVQYGRGYGATFEKRISTFGPVLQACSLSEETLGCVRGGSRSVFALGAIELIGIEYSTKVDGIVRMADLVVSHAGTGSILDALRAKKPLIVCVNDQLMDNHQQQIADKFQESGYVWACTAQADELYECLRRSQNETLNAFPQAYNVEFENELVKLAFP